jgi:hypothetical protein
VSSDLVDIFALAVLATVNPTLLGAVTVMLLLPNPKRLMLGYLLGAYATSFVAGMLILFALNGSATERTSKHKISPLEDIVVGVFALAIAGVLQTGRDQPIRERRRRRRDATLRAKEEAGKPTQSLPLRMLGKGDPRITFVVGAALSFPGLYYLSALDHIHRLHAGTAAAIVLVVAFCLMQPCRIAEWHVGLLVTRGPVRFVIAATAVDRGNVRFGQPGGVGGPHESLRVGLDVIVILHARLADRVAATVVDLIPERVAGAHHVIVMP